MENAHHHNLSSLNLIKHGFQSRELLPWESPEEYQKLIIDLKNEWDVKESTTLNALVEDLANCIWRKKRIVAIKDDTNLDMLRHHEMDINKNILKIAEALVIFRALILEDGLGEIEREIINPPF